MVTRGRCLDIQPTRILLANESGSQWVEFEPNSDLKIARGDIVEVQGKIAYLLTPNRTAERSMRWRDHVLDPRRRRGTATRSGVEKGIRDFFSGRGFLETRTPLLVPCPGMETHIRPFRVEASARGSHFTGFDVFLPTSPEFAMKRLLAGGLEKIFQITQSFRDEPRSPQHLPEFTMLEWYQAYAGYEAIQQDTEELIEFLATRLCGAPEISYQGKKISVKTPWPRLKVRDLFREHAGVDLTQAAQPEELAEHCRRLGLGADLTRETWDDLYFKIWLNTIEPKLPEDQAVFVMRYPPSQAALSVIDSDADGSRWAKRFEAYIGGLELANAFEELTHPGEQRTRFEEDMDLRERLYGQAFPPNPIDEEFLGALTEGMPPSGGIALGVDRLVMLLADEPEIDYTVWLTPGP